MNKAGPMRCIVPSAARPTTAWNCSWTRCATRRWSRRRRCRTTAMTRTGRVITETRLSVPRFYMRQRSGRRRSASSGSCATVASTYPQSSLQACGHRDAPRGRGPAWRPCVRRVVAARGARRRSRTLTKGRSAAEARLRARAHQTPERPRAGRLGRSPRQRDEGDTTRTPARTSGLVRSDVGRVPPSGTRRARRRFITLSRPATPTYPDPRAVQRTTTPRRRPAWPAAPRAAVSAEKARGRRRRRGRAERRTLAVATDDGEGRRAKVEAIGRGRGAVRIH